MGTRNSISNIPEFLIKTAFGCSLVVIAILTTFTVSHFVQGRYTLGFAVLAVIAGCSVNVWHGFQRRYSAATNTYLLFPICVLTFSYAMFELRSAASYPPVAARTRLLFCAAGKARTSFQYFGRADDHSVGLVSFRPPFCDSILGDVRWCEFVCLHCYSRD